MQFVRVLFSIPDLAQYPAISATPEPSLNHRAANMATTRGQAPTGRPSIIGRCYQLFAIVSRRLQLLQKDERLHC